MTKGGPAVQLPPPQERLCKKHERPICPSRWKSGHRTTGCWVCMYRYASHRKYEHSEKGRKRSQKYRASEKGQAWLREYQPFRNAQQRAKRLRERLELRPANHRTLRKGDA